MHDYPRIILKPGKDAAVRRFHPWIFSGAVMKVDGKAGEGDIVEVFSNRNDYLATGFYEAEGSIRVRLFSFRQQEIGPEFWKAKIREAFQLRQSLGLADTPHTNAYRLVFTEGDSIPGLIMDYYNGVVVMQAHSAGIHSLAEVFVDGVKDIFGDKLVAVYDKSSSTLMEGPGKKAKDTPKDRFLFGTSDAVTIKETGHTYSVDFIHGQKTGFFLDQRANRMFAQFYAKDKKVLNAFCYSGSFSVCCLKGGAAMVHSVDSSKQAVAWAEQNMELNGIGKEMHKTIVTDAKTYLAGTDEKYDMIILDPPAFAKHHNISHNALQAYIHINSEALKRINPGGLLFTFSCSQPVSREMFRSAVQAAAIETGRSVRVLHHLSQGPDHPVSIYHPEGEYLKGLILSVD